MAYIWLDRSIRFSNVEQELGVRSMRATARERFKRQLGLKRKEVYASILEYAGYHDESRTNPVPPTRRQGAGVHAHEPRAPLWLLLCAVYQTR